MASHQIPCFIEAREEAAGVGSELESASQNSLLDYEVSEGEETEYDENELMDGVPDCMLPTGTNAAVGMAKVTAGGETASGVTCTSAAAVATGYTAGSFDVAVGATPFDLFNLGTTTAGPASVDWHLCWAHDAKQCQRRSRTWSSS